MFIIIETRKIELKIGKVYYLSEVFINLLHRRKKSLRDKITIGYRYLNF